MTVVVGGYKTRNRSVTDLKGIEQIQLSSKRTPKLILEKLNLIDILTHCHYTDVNLKDSVCKIEDTQPELNDTSESAENQWTLHVSTSSDEGAQG